MLNEYKESVYSEDSMIIDGDMFLGGIAFQIFTGVRLFAAEVSLVRLFSPGKSPG